MTGARVKAKTRKCAQEVERVMLAVPEVCSDPPCGGTACRSPHYGDFQVMAAAAVEAVLKWPRATPPPATTPDARMLGEAGQGGVVLDAMDILERAHALCSHERGSSRTRYQICAECLASGITLIEAIAATLTHAEGLAEAATEMHDFLTTNFAREEWATSIFNPPTGEYMVVLIDKLAAALTTWRAARGGGAR